MAHLSICQRQRKKEITQYGGIGWLIRTLLIQDLFTLSLEFTI